VLNLDARNSYDDIDHSHMRQRLADIAAQCRAAYDAGQAFFQAIQFSPVDNIVVAGMGGSAMGASFVQAAYAPDATVPITIWRNYGLPGFASAARTLVIVTSKSGNTEETLDAFDTAVERGCQIVALTSGGLLAQRAREHGMPVFEYAYPYTPREGVGWLTFPVIALFRVLDIIPDPEADVNEVINLLGNAAIRLGIDSPVMRNPAKRMAGQVVHRLPILYASGLLAPVARRWKTLLNENAKLLATWDEMPELNHNAVVGFEQAEDVWRRSIVIQLRSDYDHPRVSQRFDITTRLMLEAGINQDTVRATGKSALAQVMSLVQFGDWVSYYAAIMTGIDPTPTDALDWIKAELNR